MHIGTLESYKLSSMQWSAYVRRIKQYILLNQVREDLMVPLLITAVGDATYLLMCDLYAPIYPEDMTFDQLVETLTRHIKPQRSVIAARHVFRLRRQHDGESIAEYLQNLKHLASTCSFGTKLEENLRDQFVSGIANETIRFKIFTKRNIEYKEAVDMALSLEAAERHAEVSGAVAASGNTSGSSCSGGDSSVSKELHHASVRRQRRDDDGRGPGIGGVEAAVRCDTSYGDSAHYCECGSVYQITAGGVKAGARHDESCDNETERTSMRGGKMHRAGTNGAGTVDRLDPLCVDETQGRRGVSAHRAGTGGGKAVVRQDESQNSLAQMYWFTSLVQEEKGINGEFCEGEDLLYRVERHDDPFR